MSRCADVRVEGHGDMIDFKTCSRCGGALTESERGKLGPARRCAQVQVYCTPCGQALFAELTEGTPDPVDEEPDGT